MYLKSSDCNIGIVELYDLVSELSFGRTFPNYDCTKIEIGKEIFEKIRAHYLEHGTDNFSFNMLWVCYGPKASLEGYEVRIEDGFASESED